MFTYILYLFSYIHIASSYRIFEYANIYETIYYSMTHSSNSFSTSVLSENTSKYTCSSLVILFLVLLRYRSLVSETTTHSDHLCEQGPLFTKVNGRSPWIYNKIMLYRSFRYLMSETTFQWSKSVDKTRTWKREISQCQWKLNEGYRHSKWMRTYI
jgi:hypothetical protein